MGSPIYVLDKDQQQAIVTKIRERLAELHINLDLYGFAVKATENAIYKVGVGIGVEFTCIDWTGLTQRLERHDKFIKDDETTLLGCFMAAKTKGTGFRQKGLSESVHFQINRSSCDVHIDSHGVVDNTGQYSLVGMMAHLPWDLLPFMTKNHGYVQISHNVLLAPTLGFSPSVITRLQRFYDGGLKGGLPNMREIGAGMQVGYDVQIMGHTRVGGVVSLDESALLKLKPSLTFDTINKYARLSAQVSQSDIWAKGELSVSSHLKFEGSVSKSFDSAEKTDVKVLVLYRAADW